MSLIIGPRGLQCETNLMFCESSDVVRFDLGPLLQGQTRIAKLKTAYNLKLLITLLLLVLEVKDGEPTYRKSWAGNILVWSDLILGPSFKVKQG